MKKKFKRFIALFLVSAMTLSVQELKVFAKTVSENEVIEKENTDNGQSANPTEPKTVSGEDGETLKGGQGFPDMVVDGQETSRVGINEKKMPSAPVHHCAKENSGSDYTDFSYVYFGSYPQSEVTDEVTKRAIDSAISQGSGQAAGTAENSEGIDVWVNGTRYRRISKKDTNYDGNFDDVSNNGYRYFKWERIKWRVLQNDGTTLFVVADKAVDCKDYNEEYKDITWEKSTIRSWLNNDFYNTAFSNEQGAIVAWNVVNEDNDLSGTEGGNNTTDKVYLLSSSEVINIANGFCSDYSTDSVSRWV